MDKNLINQLMYSTKISEFADVVIINGEIAKMRKNIPDENINDIMFIFDNIIIYDNDSLSIYCKNKDMQEKYIKIISMLLKIDEIYLTFCNGCFKLKPSIYDIK